MRTPRRINCISIRNISPKNKESRGENPRLFVQLLCNFLLLVIHSPCIKNPDKIGILHAYTSIVFCLRTRRTGVRIPWGPPTKSLENTQFSRLFPFSHSFMIFVCATFVQLFLNMSSSCNFALSRCFADRWV